MSACTPRDFKSYVRSAEFHALQLEHSLALAGDQAPDNGLSRFCEKQERNVKQLRRVLPSLRAKARRS